MRFTKMGRGPLGGPQCQTELTEGKDGSLLPVSPGRWCDRCGGVMGVLVTTHAKGPPAEALPDPVSSAPSPSVPAAMRTVPLWSPLLTLYDGVLDEAHLLPEDGPQLIGEIP